MILWSSSLTMSAVTILTVLTSLFSTSAGQFGDFDLAGFDLNFFPMDPNVVLPDVTNSTRWADVAQPLLEQVATHCGWSRLCNATGWKETFKEEVCSACFKCRCDDVCYERGDCCIDKALEDLGEQLVEGTLPPPAPTYTCQTKFFTRIRDPSYAYLIAHCPQSFRDAEVVKRCENASKSDVEEQWPVVSRSTKADYRNMYCAKCNGDDKDAVKWDIKIQCLDHVQLLDTSSQQAIISQIANTTDCEITFDPPQGFVHESCSPLDRDHIITTCNATGRRTAYDALMWKACEALHSYVRDSSGAFQNVFCAMCNTEYLKLNAVCAAEFPFPFVLVMSADALGRVTEAGSEQCQCPDNQVYDVYEGKCQQLHCSMTRKLKGKKCSPLFHNSTGLAYDVTVQLTPSDAIAPVELDSASSLAQVARNIRTSFLLGASSDSGWDVQMDHFRVIARTLGSSEWSRGNVLNAVPWGTGQAVNVSSFLVRLMFVTRWSEPVRNLEERLLTIIRVPWNVSVGQNGKISFMATPLYIRPDSNDTQLFESVTVYSSRDDVTEYVIDMTDTPGRYQANMMVESYVPVKATLTCTRVFFAFKNGSWAADDEKLIIDMDTGTVKHKSSGLSVPFEYNEMVAGHGVYVCADRLYESVTREPPTEALFPPALVYVSLACQSLSALCLLLTLLTFCLLPALRTLPGLDTMGLVVTLLATTLLFELGAWRVEDRESCVVVGVMIHFFLLSAFTWMVICTVHMYRIFTHVLLHTDNKEGSTATFLRHVTASVLVPAVIVACTILANYLKSDHDCFLDLGYGIGICYLSNRLSLILASILPIGLAVVINFLLFVRTLLALRRLTAERQNLTRSHQRQLGVYVKLSTLTGVNWAVGLAAAAVDSEAVWDAFLVLCGLQGLYVFVAFVCNRRVLKLYQDLFSRCCGGDKQGRGYGTRSTQANGVTNSSSDQQLYPGHEVSKSTSLSRSDNSDPPHLISNTKV